MHKKLKGDRRTIFLSYFPLQLRGTPALVQVNRASVRRIDPLASDGDPAAN